MSEALHQKKSAKLAQMDSLGKSNLTLKLGCLIKNLILQEEKSMKELEIMHIMQQMN